MIVTYSLKKDYYRDYLEIISKFISKDNSECAKESVICIDFIYNSIDSETMNKLSHKDDFLCTDLSYVKRYLDHIVNIYQYENEFIITGKDFSVLRKISNLRCGKKTKLLNEDLYKAKRDCEHYIYMCLISEIDRDPRNLKIMHMDFNIPFSRFDSERSNVYLSKDEISRVTKHIAKECLDKNLYFSEDGIRINCELHRTSIAVKAKYVTYEEV